MSMVDLSNDKQELLDKLYNQKCFSLGELPTEAPSELGQQQEEEEEEKTRVIYKFSRTRTSRLKSWPRLSENQNTDPRKLLLKKATPAKPTVRPANQLHRKAKSMIDSSISKQNQEEQPTPDVFNRPKLSKERNFRRKSSTQTELKAISEKKCSENWITDLMKTNPKNPTLLVRNRTRHISDVSTILANCKSDKDPNYDSLNDPPKLSDSSIFSVSKADSLTSVRSILKNSKGRSENVRPTHHGKTHSMIFFDCKKVKFS